MWTRVRFIPTFRIISTKRITFTGRIHSTKRHMSTTTTPASSTLSAASTSTSTSSATTSTSTSHPPTYVSTLSQLLAINRDRRISFGIDTTHKLLTTLGPAWSPNNFITIHVAGTNGKGSVSTKLAKALQIQGAKVGLFTSPHISTFRERMLINGEMISEQEVVDLCQPLLSLASTSIPATFFELTTALGFGWFSHHHVDVAVIEVGLGGRLDSTNVITPCISIITSIGLDHTSILGPDIPSIAREKAGIIKPNIPVVIGPSVPVDVIQPIANEKHAPLYRVTHTYTTFDDENNATTKLAMDVMEKMYKDTLLMGKGWKQGTWEIVQHTLPPCRFEKNIVNVQDVLSTSSEIPITTITTTSTSTTTSTYTPSSSSSSSLPSTVNVICDVGHNPQAFERLFTTWTYTYPQHDIRAIIGMSVEKDAVDCLSYVIPRVKHLHLVQADSPRAASVTDLMAHIQKHNLLSGQSCQIHITANGDVKSTVREAIRHTAIHNATIPSTSTSTSPSPSPSPRPESILICGSFFILRDVRIALHTKHPYDPFDINEQAVKK